MNRRKFIKYALLTGCLIGFSTSTGLYFKKQDDSSLYETFDSYYKGEYIPNLDVPLAEHCNLNCKYCNHFSNIAEPEFYTVKEYKKDMVQLKKITDGRVRQLLLLGGEPLLNPKVTELMEISRKYFPRTHIRLLTNGLLLNNMPDKFWEVMSIYNVYLEISVYRPFMDIDKAFAEKIKEYGIKSEPDNFSYISPTDTFNKFDIDIEGSQDYRKQFFNCTANLAQRHRNHPKILSHTCSQLNKGKIYQCHIAGGIRHFNKKFNKDLKITEADYLDIYKAKNFDDVLKFMDTPTPFCRYCGGRYYDPMPWEASKEHDISEWVYS